MKKFSGLYAILVWFCTAGCFDTVEETTISDAGSGVYVSSIDMGKMLGALAAMGGDEKMKEAQKLKADTTVLFKDISDSIRNLTATEKKLLEKAKARLIMNMEEEKFSLSFTVPFSKLSDLPAIHEALKKSKAKAGEKLVDKMKPSDVKGNDNDALERDETPDVSAYFESTYEKNKMTRKVNKEKFAKIAEDQSLKSLKEIGQMGMPVNFKTVINLPKPAKKANGKGITLSDDKKTVMIAGTLEDFLEDPSSFEYEIEY